MKKNIISTYNVKTRHSSKYSIPNTTTIKLSKEEIRRLQRSAEKEINREIVKSENPIRALSRRYLNDAKRLGYKWLDLLRKATRDNVINKVIKFRMADATKKAKRDRKQQKIRNIELEKLEDNVKREHQRLMEKQPGYQTADVLIFQRYDNEKDIPEGRKIAF